MKFKVKFCSKFGQSAYVFAEKSNGIDVLDLIRETIPAPKLDAALVDDLMKMQYGNPTIEISEEQARESGLFSDSGHVVVQVEDKWLNQFFDYHFDVFRKEETQEIQNVTVSMKCDEAALLDAWKADGYPEKWIVLQDA